MKTGMKVLAAVVLTGVGIAAAMEVSQGFAPAVFQRPIGTICGCNVIASAPVSCTNPPRNFLASVNGIGSFEYIANSPDGDPNPWSDLKPAGLTLTGNDPVLGAFRILQDPNKASTISRIQSDNPNGLPASADLYINFQVVFNNQPGVIYDGVDELHLQTNNITTWPQVNQVYQQLNASRLHKQSDPVGTVSGIINAGTVTLTGNPC